MRPSNCPHDPRPKVNECNGDISPTTPRERGLLLPPRALIGPCRNGKAASPRKRLRIWYAGSLLLPHHELLVAGQRARGCGDGDKAGGGTVRNNRRDQGPRQHGEGGRRAVKADTGRASQVGPQNPGGPPDPAEVGLCFHERAQAYRDLVDRTFVAGSERIRRPVEAPIGGLDHTLVDVKLCATAMRAKAVKRVE